MIDPYLGHACQTSSGFAHSSLGRPLFPRSLAPSLPRSLGCSLTLRIPWAQRTTRSHGSHAASLPPSYAFLPLQHHNSSLLADLSRARPTDRPLSLARSIYAYYVREFPDVYGLLLLPSAQQGLAPAPAGRREGDGEGQALRPAGRAASETCVNHNRA